MPVAAEHMANRLSTLRDMSWLTARRATLYGAALTTVLCVWFARAAMILYDHGGYAGDYLFGSDFLSFWAASRQILLGKAAEVYTPALHLLAEQPFLRIGYKYFFYPPTYMVVCAPLALLPFFISYALFQGVTFATFTGFVWRVFRRPWSVFAFLSFPAISANLVAGQNALLTASLLGFGLTLLDRRPRIAGFALGLMVIKPHLALAVPIALVVTGRWRALIWAAMSAVGLIALSCLLFGFDTWAGFFANAKEARLALENGVVGFAKMQSAFALARAFGASVETAYILQGFVALAAVCALVWVSRRKIGTAVERSMIVIAGFLMTPFSLHYDSLLFALPLVWMLNEWRERRFPPWSKLVLCIVFFAPALALVPVPFGVPTLLLFSWLLLREVPKERTIEGAMRGPEPAV